MAANQLRELCRICLKTDNEELLHIYKSDAIVEDLPQKIEFFGGIELYIAENAPDCICLKCLMMLKMAVKFRRLCQQSQQQLYKMLELNMEESIDGNNDNDDKIERLEDSNSNQSSCMPDNIAEYTIEAAVEPVDDEDLQVDIKPLTDSNLFDCEFLENEEAMYSERVQIAVDDMKLSNLEQPLEDFVDDTTNIQSFEILDSDSMSEDISLKHKRARNADEGSQKLNLQSKIKTVHLKELLAEPKRKTSNKKTGKLHKSKVGVMHVCSICSNVYQEKAKLTLHMKVHSQLKPHKCEICYKSFAQTPQLARHMNTHTGNRPFKCKFCSSSFADPSTCIKHERIHTNVKPFKCETCGKQFAYSNVLKVHLMMHTGEKPFSCVACGKRFTQLHHMRAHVRTHTNKLQQQDT